MGKSLAAVELIDFSAQRTFPLRPSGYGLNSPVSLKPFAFITDRKGAQGIVLGRNEGENGKIQRIKWEIFRVRTPEKKR